MGRVVRVQHLDLLGQSDLRGQRGPPAKLGRKVSRALRVSMGLLARREKKASRVQ